MQTVEDAEVTDLGSVLRFRKLMLGKVHATLNLSFWFLFNKLQNTKIILVHWRI